MHRLKRVVLSPRGHSAAEVDLLHRHRAGVQAAHRAHHRTEAALAQRAKLAVMGLVRAHRSHEARRRRSPPVAAMIFATAIVAAAPGSSPKGPAPGLPAASPFARGRSRSSGVPRAADGQGSAVDRKTPRAAGSWRRGCPCRARRRRRSPHRPSLRPLPRPRRSPRGSATPYRERGSGGAVGTREERATRVQR